MSIQSSEIQLRRAGSAGLGGAIATVAAQGFSTVQSAESTTGSVKYRCVYVRNGHSSETLSAAKLWLSANTPSPSTEIAVGLGTSGIGGTEQTIPNEATAPSGVTFGPAVNEAAALALGDLGPQQWRAVWERRTVIAGAAELAQDTYERTVSGEGPEEQAVAATVQNLWTGVPTSGGVVISSKMNSQNSAESSRVAVSRTADLASPVYSAPVAPDATYRVAKHVLSGLLPNTEYFYGVEVDSVLDTATIGRFKTLPAAGPASFSIALGGCAENTNDATFAALNAMSPAPLFLIAVGDFQYMDIASPTLAQYHAAFDASLARAARKQAHSRIPTAYMWDDHDFGTDNSTGRDNSNTARSFRATGLSFFRSRVPAVTASAVSTDTVHYSFVVGRVRFVVTDVRADKTGQGATDNASKTMMGAAQKAWFKGEIAAARAAGQAIAWVNSVPWCVAPVAGDDTWGGYTTERTEIADYVKAQKMQGRVFILSADMHALAIHAGADYATGGGGAIPIFHAGPFNRKPSNKGGPYTYGPYPTAGSQTPVQQYGIMQVEDDGSTLTVTWRGYTADGTERMSHSFVALSPATAPSRMAAPVVSAGNAQAIVNLTEPDDGGSPITHYTVTSSPAGGVDQQAGTAQKARTVTGLQNGTAYTFTAVAINDIGASQPSPASEPVTPNPPFASGFNATGGQVSEPNDGYRYWTFLADGTLDVSSAGEVEFVCAAGGGAGSTGGSSVGGPGAAGGFKTDRMTIPVGTHAVKVGVGGLGGTSSSVPGTAGTNSSIGTLVETIGGGRGAVAGQVGGNGGSGGGAAGGGATSQAPGSGTAGQGNNGGTAISGTTVAQRASGGGGGATTAGEAATAGNAGDGGEGVEIWGRQLAGGGGGATQGLAENQGVGKHGGGNGSKTAPGGDATPNSGSGGGGATNDFRGGNGASGIVIIRRPV